MIVGLIRDALRNLTAHRMRVALTAIGMAWSVCVLVVLESYAIGFERHFTAQLEKIGRRVVYAYPGARIDARRGAHATRPVRFRARDAERLRPIQQAARAGIEVSTGQRLIRGPRGGALVSTLGVDVETVHVRDFVAAAGRLIDHRDVREAARVVVIGARAAERLYGAEDPVGRSVHIEGVPFEIIGVLARKGTQIVFVGPADDAIALVPFSSAQRWLTRSRDVSALTFSTVEVGTSKRLITNVRTLLGLHHDFEPEQDGALGFFDLEEGLSLIARLGLGLRIFLGATGAISVLVGAVGVANVMLVSVGERRREIGVRRAIGARVSAVAAGFVVEALIITAASGGVGALSGVLATLVLGRRVPADNAFAPVPILDLGVLTWLVGSLLAAAFIAGTLPALRAARLSPSVAVRSR